MPRHDDPTDLKAFTAAALVGLCGREAIGGHADLAKQALAIGHATRNAVRAQLDAEERQAEREREAERQREDDKTNF